MINTGYENFLRSLPSKSHTWLITGVAGFIGSNLLEVLLKLNQRVVGLDNFSTGYRRNLDEVRASVTPEQWLNFEFVSGDIRELDSCVTACKGVDYVLHQAALGSVPRSFEDPISTNQANVDGFLNMLVAAKNNNVKSFVYASSSSVYGDSLDLPKVEAKIGSQLSPYAATKYFDEIYAGIFSRSYGLRTVGLRYFNVFGKRQDANGSYAAVIPSWIKALIDNAPVYINGDGSTSRDFCYVENVVQANLLAASSNNLSISSEVYNIANSKTTSLNELYNLLKTKLISDYPHLQTHQPIYRDFRFGDVLHSLADISLARSSFGYDPKFDVSQGLNHALVWYIKSSKSV
jgi:UDP-N-acetylglucosamine 4-epimerase